MVVSAGDPRLRLGRPICHGRGPLHSINFITCHDGFTLYDLVSYDNKHNEMPMARGTATAPTATGLVELRRRGADRPTPTILALRKPDRSRNLMATLLDLARGAHAHGGRRVPPHSGGE